MKGIFYSVGTGPGDPKLITVKAIETIKAADIILLPEHGTVENAAQTIAREYLSGKECVYINTPMIRDICELNRIHEQNTDTVAAMLDLGKNVAALTLGDPGIYSTATYIQKRLRERGYETVIIPGVPSFCAVAAALQTSLCEGSEVLHIIPASYGSVDETLSLPGNKILMKSGKAIGELRGKLELTEAQAVECCGMENEKIYHTLDNIDDAGYFCVVLVKDRKEKKA